jgi:CRISPR-associated protein (TIGR02584 family)
MEEHLLVLLGLHPKVLTETLYVLGVKRGVKLSKLTVICTANARQKILNLLLTPGTGRFHDLLREYSGCFDALEFTEANILVARNGQFPVQDIGDSGQSQAYLDLILSGVNEITTGGDTRLHAVVGGGRRTLSVYLAMVMQLLAREQDRLYHLVVSPWEVETDSDFYYPTREPRVMVTYGGKQFEAKDVNVDLVEIPFIRLRNRFPVGKLNARTGPHLLQWMQHELNGALVFPELVLDREKSCLWIGPDRVDLQPQQFCLYWYFADLSRGRSQELPSDAYESYFEASGSPYFSDAMLKGLVGRLDAIDPSHDKRQRFEATVLEHGNLPMTWVLQKIARINERIRQQLSQAHLIPFYSISAVGKRGGKYYGIKVSGEKIVTLEVG